jgi:hypothetical protein
MDTLPSETFGTVPHDAEAFGSVPHTSEGFGSVPHATAKTDNHTLTVREAARMFEDAGVARTERSITNWCNPNKQGVARLDCFFDTNDGRYWITPASVERAIAEEHAKTKAAETAQPLSESFGTVPHASARDAGPEKRLPDPREEPDAQQHIAELEKELLDLRVLNRAKDLFLEELKKDREYFAHERTSLIAQFVENARRLGQLETKVLEIAAPGEEPAGRDQQPTVQESRTLVGEEDTPQPNRPTKEDT